MYIAESEKLLELLQNSLDGVPGTDLEDHVLAYMTTRNRMNMNLRTIYDAGVPLELVRAGEEIVENIPDRLRQSWLDEFVTCLSGGSNVASVWPRFGA